MCDDYSLMRALLDDPNNIEMNQTFLAIHESVVSKMIDLKILSLKRVWIKSGGKSFVPQQRMQWNNNPYYQHPMIEKWITADLLVRIDARCGFESIKNEAVNWTKISRNLFQKRT